jgi:DNA repair protein RadC
MKTFSYERPREKLQQKGASALSNAELLQVIIGSGNAGMPVTRIARRVDKKLRIKATQVTMDDLTAIQGVGLVKAGQIVAAFELVMRLEYQASPDIGASTDILTDLYIDVRNSHKQTLFYAFFDGAGRLVDDHSRAIGNGDNTNQIVRKMFAEALAQSAASIQIILGYDDQSLDPTITELDIARDSYRTAALLSIPVKSFDLVNKVGEYSIKEAYHE